MKSFQIPQRSKKTFQISTYILNTQWLRNNENCFTETKVLQMKQKLITSK